MDWIKTKAGLQMAETIIRQLPKIANNKENSIDKYEEDLLKVIEEIDGLKQSVINLSFRIRKLESKENIIGEVRYMKRWTNMNLLTKNDKIKKIFKSFDLEVQEAIKFLINEIQAKREIKKLEKSENEESWKQVNAAERK